MEENPSSELQFPALLLFLMGLLVLDYYFQFFNGHYWKDYGQVFLDKLLLLARSRCCSQ